REILMVRWGALSTDGALYFGSPIKKCALIAGVLAMDEESIFLQALEKPAAADREAFLDQACAGNAELRRGVQQLLRAHAKAGNFLQESLGTVTIDEPVPERPGTVIGP